MKSHQIQCFYGKQKSGSGKAVGSEETDNDGVKKTKLQGKSSTSQTSSTSSDPTANLSEFQIKIDVHEYDDY